MNENTLQIQFSEELRGKNAMNFWVGIAIIVAAVYGWLKGWFSMLGFETGLLDPGEGMGSGFAVLAIDTVCLIGLAGVAAFRFCKDFVMGLLDRAGFVAEGAMVWSAKEQGVQPPLVVDQVRSNFDRLEVQDHRIQSLEQMIVALSAKLEATAK